LAKEFESYHSKELTGGMYYNW